MISKNKIKYIHSLELKKNRDSENVFVAEGPKVVADIARCYIDDVLILIAIQEWFDANPFLTAECTKRNCELIVVSQEELRKVSFLCHPQQVMAVFSKHQSDIMPDVLQTKLSLVLDGVQDPGNLGTIIRIADWFGIEDVICSKDTVDVYNPKVVQATMGSIARVNVVYTDLKQLIETMPADFPVYGTLLEGKNIYSQELSKNGFIIMGNEGKGLSAPIRETITNGLRIPNYPPERETADSLNVAIATAIVCAEFRRNI